MTIAAVAFLSLTCSISPGVRVIDEADTGCSPFGPVASTFPFIAARAAWAGGWPRTGRAAADRDGPACARGAAAGEGRGRDEDGGEELQGAGHVRAFWRNVLLIRAASAGSPSWASSSTTSHRS